jgi:hypothetical protein
MDRLKPYEDPELTGLEAVDAEDDLGPGLVFSAE